jgi:NADH dehydrogenase
MKKTIIETDILILGAGIGGYETFRTLSKELKKNRLPQKITIVDQNNFFTFTPMLHEVASGAIEPSHCTVSLRELVYTTPHEFIKSRVTKIDPTKKMVATEAGSIHYTYLVIGLGSGVNYFNTPGAAENSYNVRTLVAAMKLRHDIVAAFEANQEPLTISIIGGGYTGIETASQLLHLFQHDLTKLYPGVKAHIRVVEAGNTILSTLPNQVQQTIKAYLMARGIEFILAKPVKSVEKNSITFTDGTELSSTITVWCAGVKNQADSYLPSEFQEKGRLPVNQYLQLTTDESVYVVGDMALFKNQDSEIPVPQLGESAHQEGRYVAKKIANTLKKRTTKPFAFRSLGMLIPVGDWYGVLIAGNFVLFGALAWWIRRTAYLLFMPGLLRKLKIIVDWTLHSLSFRYIINIDT